jgi:DNA mismatch repair ATPase MutS
MKVFLMHRERDFDLEQELPANEPDLRQDLELDTLLHAMAGDDEFLFEVARVALLSSLTDPGAIAYRQEVLADCLAHPDVARELYDVAVEAGQAERQVIVGLLRSSPETILYRSVRILELLLDTLKRLRGIADEHGSEFRSEGFRRFFAMLEAELGDEYFERVEEHLKRLSFRDGVLISARLGRGNKGIGYTLRRRTAKPSWRERLPLTRDHSAYTFVIPERDDAGAKALSDLKARGINLVANALAQSTEHVLSFFNVLRVELGFHVACLNLHERLAAKGEPVCFPVVAGAGEAALSGRGLYDTCLSLSLDGRVVGNDLGADGKGLIVITGANQGGKSTFLRALGLAQLMMQAGMFVSAESLRAGVCEGVFTHYKREEDATMKSGKLDEELRRMSGIADHIRPNCILLCNESFASTNEREGSEIARRIGLALLERSIRVFYVTHLFELADSLHREREADGLFLRAERKADASRTYKLVEGAPLPTSYGQDLYERVFGGAAAPAAAGGQTLS